VVLERPVIYPHMSQKNPNDLIDVALTAGLCQIVGREVVLYAPYAWKGQTPKKIHQERIKNLLSDEEQGKLGRYHAQSDVLDAVGIGLRYLKRF
jgi:hypothetical protein